MLNELEATADRETAAQSAVLKSENIALLRFALDCLTVDGDDEKKNPINLVDVKLEVL